MKELLRSLTPLAWAIVVVAIVSALGVGWWLVTEPGRAHKRTAEAQVDARLADARTGAATDAVVIQGNTAAAAAKSEQLSRESADVIRASPGADLRLDPRLNSAGRQRLCLRAAYRDRPECVQLARGADAAR